MVNMLKPDGTKIRILRIQRGWRQVQLAGIADVSLRTIQRVEEGGNASFITLRSLARAFELEAQQLMLDSVEASQRRDGLETGILRALMAKAGTFLSCGWQPYLPLAKMSLFSFSFVLLVACLIRLSPLLIDSDYEVESAGFTPIAQDSAPPASLAAKVEQRRANRIRTVAIMSKSFHLDFRTGREKVQPQEASSSPPTLTHVTPEPVHAQNPTPTPGATKAGANASQGIAGMIDIAWLAELSHPELISGGMHGQSSSVASDPGERNVAAPAAQANSVATAKKSVGEGRGILSRSILRSGKGTAAFFAKVGSSIKRAF
jgi:transcriptional regulator with XRE-family HTH domain